MIIVEKGFEEINIDDLYRKVEMCGRVCYKSENLITKNSGKVFVSKILNNHHGAVLEHYQFVFRVTESLYAQLKKEAFPFVTLTNISMPLVSFNLRTLVENFACNPSNILWKPFYNYVAKRYPDIIALESDENEDIVLMKREDLLKLDLKERDEHLKITIKVITDRGVTHELVRHRLCSFAQESTRYCNYAKDKFSNQISVIKPVSIEDETSFKIWKNAMEAAEQAYFELLNTTSSPQVARSVLPNSLKTELMMTATIKEWRLIFDLRTAAAAHPDCRALMLMVKDYFTNRGYL